MARNWVVDWSDPAPGLCDHERAGRVLLLWSQSGFPSLRRSGSHCGNRGGGCDRNCDGALCLPRILWLWSRLLSSPRTRCLWSRSRSVRTDMGSRALQPLRGLDPRPLAELKKSGGTPVPPVSFLLASFKGASPCAVLPRLVVPSAICPSLAPPTAHTYCRPMIKQDDHRNGYIRDISGG